MSNFWVGKNVLVTGASGFLGGWLCRKLLQNRANVAVIVRNPKPRSQFYLEGMQAQTKVIIGDATDRGVILHALGGAGVDVIFHLTSLVDVNAALTDPIGNFHSAVDTTITLLEEVRRISKQIAVVVCTTDKVYGAQQCPFREDMPLLPVHPYEIAKAAQDELARSYAKIYGMKISVTRCGNFFGGYDFHYERIIPHTLRQIVLGKAPILRSDGKFTRDFLYIEEAAAAHMMVAECLVNDDLLKGRAINFSYEVELSVIDLVMKIMTIAGVYIEPIIQSTARTESINMRLDTTFARNTLGWKPEIDFDSALRRTIEWYRAFSMESNDV